MTRMRLFLSEEDARRQREIMVPARRNWHDRLWDWTPKLVVAGLIWLAVLTCVVGWLFWRSVAQ